MRYLPTAFQNQVKITANAKCHSCRKWGKKGSLSAGQFTADKLPRTPPYAQDPYARRHPVQTLGHLEMKSSIEPETWNRWRFESTTGSSLGCDVHRSSEVETFLRSACAPMPDVPQWRTADQAEPDNPRGRKKRGTRTSALSQLF